MVSPAMLICWKILKKINARVFRSEASTSNLIVNKMKDEVVMWSLAGLRLFVI
jgi:hypothetical protein